MNECYIKNFFLAFKALWQQLSFTNNYLKRFLVNEWRPSQSEMGISKSGAMNLTDEQKSLEWFESRLRDSVTYWQKIELNIYSLQNGREISSTLAYSVKHRVSCICKALFLVPIPASFTFIFVFSNKHYKFFTANICIKCPSRVGIWTHNLQVMSFLP